MVLIIVRTVTGTTKLVESILKPVRAYGLFYPQLSLSTSDEICVITDVDRLQVDPNY